MPARTRDEMHIMLDVELEILQSSKFNQIDAPAKDIYLNTVQDEFIKEAIDEINSLMLSRRIPQGNLTYPDITKYFNKLRTLITSEVLVPYDASGTYVQLNTGSTTNFTYNGVSYVLTIVCPVAHGLIDGQNLLVNFNVGATVKIFVGNVVTNGLNEFSVAFGSNLGTPTAINYVYKFTQLDIINYTYPTTLLYFISAKSKVCRSNCNNLKEIPVIIPAFDDLNNINSDPFSYMFLTALQDTSYFKLFINNKFDIYNTTMSFIKKPNQIGSGVNCNLPDFYHDELVTKTAKYISAFTNNPNYQPVAIEAKS